MPLGAPFNSRDFTNFTEEEGFNHHRITPEHPRANGEVESFMRILNKTEQIAHLQNQIREISIQEMLVGYRSTPHPAAGMAPYQGMMNWEVRIKLDYINNSTANETEIAKRERKYKENMKLNAGRPSDLSSQICSIPSSINVVLLINGGEFMSILAMSQGSLAPTIF